MSANSKKTNDALQPKLIVKAISELNRLLSRTSQAGIDVELDFVSDDESDAELIDLISIKRRLWEPEYEEE